MDTNVKRRETVERIVGLRNQYGLSQSELAKKIGIGTTAVNKIEKGIRGISAEELAQIADVFDVSTDYLLGFKSHSSDNDAFDIEKALDNDDYMTYGGRPLTDEEKKILAKILRDD